MRRLRLSTAPAGARRPAYEEQIKQIKLWLDETKAKGTKKVFIAFHAPAFCRSGMGQFLRSGMQLYEKDLDILVFNGHVHTTKAYRVDGRKYFALGGGGTEQDQSCPAEHPTRLPMVICWTSTGRARHPKRITIICTRK